MALSVIDSGCVVTLTDGAAVFVVKDRVLAPRSGDGFEPLMGFRFEHIARDEFPSVCSILSIDAGERGKFSYDYFFMPDSGADVDALSALCGTRGGEVWFSDGAVRFAVTFEPAETEQINTALRSVRGP